MIHIRLIAILFILCTILITSISPVSGVPIENSTGTSEKIASFIQDLVISGKPEQAYQDAVNQAPQKPSVTSLDSSTNSTAINSSCTLLDMYLKRDINNSYSSEYSGKYNFTELDKTNKDLFEKIISKYQSGISESQRFAECCAYPKSSF